MELWNFLTNNGAEEILLSFGLVWAARVSSGCGPSLRRQVLFFLLWSGAAASVFWI